MNDTQPKKKELKTREDALLALANSQEPLAIKLTNDFAFKKAFSNKKVMKGFLNALPLFKGIPIADIEFTNTFLSGDTLEDREGILDLRLRLANQTKINIEMQVEPFADWAERTLFYTSKMYTENFLHGQPYGMLEPCIHIGILHFSCMKSPEFYHVIHLCDEKTGEIYSDKMEFFVIELKKLETADYQEKQSELWKWAQLI
ncbi:MAG: Rpn family recombination-promoting nuclease/putative transposase, partial [Lachnospiraceae bacterium]